jgi:chromosome segregation ATPase
MVAKTGRKKAARSTSNAGVSEKLRALQANRERVDAEAAARRTREDELMRRYAVAADQSDRIRQRQAAKLEELQAEIRRLDEDTERQIKETEAAQHAAIGELHGLGRSAEELSRLFDMPTKRVRGILRTLKPAKRKPNGNDPVASEPEDGSSAGGESVVRAATAQ